MLPVCWIPRGRFHGVLRSASAGVVAWCFNVLFRLCFIGSSTFAPLALLSTLTCWLELQFDTGDRTVFMFEYPSTVRCFLSVFKRSLIFVWVRPGRYSAITHYLAPCCALISSKILSSPAVKGVLFNLGTREHFHLSLHCFAVLPVPSLSDISRHD